MGIKHLLNQTVRVKVWVWCLICGFAGLGLLKLINDIAAVVNCCI